MFSSEGRGLYDKCVKGGVVSGCGLGTRRGCEFGKDVVGVVVTTDSSSSSNHASSSSSSARGSFLQRRRPRFTCRPADSLLRRGCVCEKGGG